MILSGDPPQQAALDEHPKDTHQQRRQYQCNPVIHAQVVEPEHGDEGAQHVLGAMGEVDDPQEPENDRQAQAQQSIEGPIDQPQEQLAEQYAQRNTEYDCHDLPPAGSL
ncbi:hypothetical protein D3C87_1704020 [compost metagenome]